jgi:hypothetical protein
MYKQGGDWKLKVLEGTQGTQSGSILRNVFDANRDTDYLRFEGKASITLDGFVMCNFIDKNGNGHWEHS